MDSECANPFRNVYEKHHKPPYQLSKGDNQMFHSGSPEDAVYALKKLDVNKTTNASSSKPDEASIASVRHVSPCSDVTTTAKAVSEKHPLYPKQNPALNQEVRKLASLPRLYDKMCQDLDNTQVIMMEQLGNIFKTQSLQNKLIEEHTSCLNKYQEQFNKIHDDIQNQQNSQMRYLQKLQEQFDSLHFDAQQQMTSRTSFFQEIQKSIVRLQILTQQPQQQQMIQVDRMQKLEKQIDQSDERQRAIQQLRTSEVGHFNDIVRAQVGINKENIKKIVKFEKESHKLRLVLSGFEKQQSRLSRSVLILSVFVVSLIIAVIWLEIPKFT